MRWTANSRIAKANVKRRSRPSSEYIAIMKVSARTPNSVIAFIQPLPSCCSRARCASDRRYFDLDAAFSILLPVV